MSKRQGDGVAKQEVPRFPSMIIAGSVSERKYDTGNKDEILKFGAQSDSKRCLATMHLVKERMNSSY